MTKRLTSAFDSRGHVEHTAIRRAFLSGAGAKIGTVFLNFLSIGFALRDLGPDGFALILTLYNMIAIVGFLDFGIGNSIITSVASAAGLERDATIRQTLSNAFAVLSTVCALILLLGLPVGWFALDHVLPGLSHTSTVVVFIFVVSCAVAIPASLGTKLAIAFHYGYANSMTFFSSSAVTCALCGLGVVLGMPTPYYALTFFAVPPIANAVQTALIVTRLSEFQRPRASECSKGEQLILIRGGIPFMVLAMAGAATYQTQTLVILSTLGTTAATNFGIAVRVFTALITLFSSGLQQTWGGLASALGRGDTRWAQVTFFKVLALTLATSTICCLFLISARTVIFALLSDGQAIPSAGLLSVLSVWTVYNLAMTQVSFLLNSADRVWLQAALSALMAIVAVPLSVVLAKLLGPVGPVLATLTTHISLLLIPTTVQAVHVLRPRSRS